MSRLGTWTPTTVDDRLDRMESHAAIRQLPYRYALALDSRTWTRSLTSSCPTCRSVGTLTGREALKGWFTNTMRRMRTSVHFIGNHIIDFDDADHAHGIVYCRDELEQTSTEEWEVGMLQYWDSYGGEGEWCFQRRRFHRWYIVDALTRPSHGAGVGNGAGALTTHQLPEAFPSWDRFWSSLDQSDG